MTSDFSQAVGIPATKSYSLLALAFCLLVNVTNEAPAQSFVQTGLNSIDTPVDPRSIAMAESFVALRNNSMALMYNPAGLASARGVSLSYSHRRLNWLDDLSSTKYFALATSIQTPIVNIGLLYNRFEQGEFIITGPESPEEAGRAKVYDYVLGLGVARSFGNHWDIGLTVKTYNVVETITGASIPVYPLETTHRPYLLDFGVIYSHPDVIRTESSDDEFAVAVALQNFGTDFKIKAAGFRSDSSPPMMIETLLKLPRYLRFGVSYSLTIMPQSKEKLTPFKFLITGEYRNFLNPGTYQKADRDFWGLGIEATFLDILAARVGGYIAPYSSIYGERATPHFRYGVGVNLPLARIGVDSPISIRMDYAGIPVRNPSFSRVENSTLKAFCFGLTYEEEIF